MTKLYRSIGLMSGTSMDGIDLALIESDGKEVINRKNFYYKAYENDFKKRLKSLIYETSSLEKIKSVENELTLLHADLVKEFLSKNNIDKNSIDLISFHGHTILHLPEKSITWQIGNGYLLAKETAINVICDFRTHDVMLGGQAAPLVPIYHFNLLHNQKKPTAVLNIGGISNITYFNSDDENSIEAFDTCFGNAPFDDLMREKFGVEFDKNGELSNRGNADFILADRILQNDIFHKKPPKSFDRDDFSILLAPIKSLQKPEDALATFAYMHAKAISLSLDFFSQKPHDIFVCGGGRKNIAIMDEMKKWLPNIRVRTIEEIGFNGDSVEAEAFAFLGIRSLLNLPISFPKTTGVKKASCGAVLYKC
ncbi:MAG: anhydro-N-acetylmuramic acid kinase [Rickettsiales bacterium]|nr:anhydro-N-acetylmuramic acid kinase [Rickettsiales bacterium]